jgi:predicted homoserine dehydrogenase-like protein
MPAATALEMDGLPIGLAHGLKLARPLKAGASLSLADVEFDRSDPLYRLRQEMVTERP